VRTTEQRRRRALLDRGADMNYRKGVQENRSRVPANHHAGTTRTSPESREHAIGAWVQAAAPTTEDRLQTVLSILTNGVTCAQAALLCGVAEADVEQWKRLFIDSGRQGLLTPERVKPQSPAASLRFQNTFLKAALCNTLAELRSYHREARGQLGPFERVEQIRRESAITIARLCALTGMSRRTYARRLKPLRSAKPREDNRDSTSIVSTCAQLVDDYMANHPGYGYRRIHELMIADGHIVSASTVHRAIQVSQAKKDQSARDTLRPARRYQRTRQGA
jgi:transposase-like protein